MVDLSPTHPSIIADASMGLYIHVPWCRRRCPYCDFYFEVGKPQQQFTKRIIDEWRNRRIGWQAKAASSLYFGGGTPSLLSTDELCFLINFFKTNNALDDDCEITIEANPEDISEDYAHSLKTTGVNRLSLGIQSFDDHILLKLGRMHRERDARHAIERLQRAGFKNISVDLILGVEGENPAAIKLSLEYLHSQGIPHISAYLLTIEDHTNFSKRIAKGAMKPPDEDQQVDIYQSAQVVLCRLGYEQYDVSSYAHIGGRSRHNQNYWAKGSFLGLGPGAHSMRLLSDGSVERAHNKATNNEWLADPIESDNFSCDRLSPKRSLNESLAFGLRNMADGLDPTEQSLRHRCALPKDFFAVIEKYKEYGWLERKENKICMTGNGALFADAIMRDILSL